MIDLELDQYRKDIATKYIDRYYITLDKAIDLDKEYDEIIEYEYKDDSKIWKKILFPLDLIEGYYYSKYVSIFGEPLYGFIDKHPPMFRVNLIPKYNYVAIPPKINCSFAWSIEETEKITFLKTQKVVSTEKVGNIIVKRIKHKKVMDLDKLFQILNYEFGFLKFRLTEVGFTRIFSGDKVELDNKDHAILL